jgi:hypothetical protein
MKRGSIRRDRRKEYERRVDTVLDELHDKGFSKERAREYQLRQTQWWKECDRYNSQIGQLK